MSRPAGIVGPAHCIHCSRSIYPLGDGWVHGHNGLATCYSPSGDRLTATPRNTVRSDAS